MGVSTLGAVFNEGGGVATHSATTGHIGVRPGHVRCKTCELKTGIEWEAHSSARCVRRRPLAVEATSSAAAGVSLVHVKVGLPTAGGSPDVYVAGW